MWFPLEQLEQHVQDLGLPDECPYCNKLSFVDKNQAKCAARHSAHTKRIHLWAYKCPKGKGWHLTSKKPDNSASVPKKRKPPKSHKIKKCKDLRQNNER